MKNKKIILVLLLNPLILISATPATARNRESDKVAETVPPKITKTFNPTSISVNEFVTMSIAFSNSNAEAAFLTAPFSEKLPAGMLILGSASTSCDGTLVADKVSGKVTLTGAKIPAFGSCQILLGVTSAKAGNFESKTPVGALQTDKGNNIGSSDAKLTVTIPTSNDLRIKKSFNPPVIKPNEFTTLIIALNNPNGEVARLTAPFREYLPDGMLILGRATTTCQGKLRVRPNTAKIELSEARIPAFGTCEISLGVTASEDFTNLAMDDW